ncbi:MAG: sigma 54-interacting transcriptional regulator [Deltaproteobacteria bacterium]|nr:sigma 54-interacting transcriptional regulator [Deltaproteobacteria bacterium]MBW2072324.1 sigma 54-interacting transcriptional regulator [Deltaproteobacteria bacterium]
MSSGKQKSSKKSDHRREHEELQSLWKISQSLYQYLNVNDLILHIIKQITEVMNAETASVILYDDQRDELVFRWSSDIPERADKLEEMRFPANHGIAGSVFASGRPEIILDVEKDYRHYSKVDSATKFRTRSMVAVPLKTKVETIGVLEVINKRLGHFDNADLNFLVTLAPIIAMALDNARMCSQLNEAYKQLQLIDKGKDELIRRTRNEVVYLRREVERRHRFSQIIGNSQKMIEVFKLCEKVVDSAITVHIYGETGTGKELVARTIHYNGPRRDKPFVSQNCGGIPDTLLASELFGQKKGAFTGAFKDKKGLFEMAHGGTVFLDEVGDTSPAMQMSLLRVLQEGEIKPLGSERSKKVDVRIISASNQDLAEEVKAGRFREDLLYRLCVFTIELPPLRERKEDIPLLAAHFVKQFRKKTKKPVRGLSRKAIECLSRYNFPGNVRELENEIERAIAMAGTSQFIEPSHLSEKITMRGRTEELEVRLDGTLKEMVTELEKSVLKDRLEKYRGNKTRVARDLGLSRYGLIKKIQRYNL